MIFESILFYIFSAVLIFAATMVIISRNTVYSALYLVLAFFATSALWILLEAEFLALILVLVYVGAVMTLFLFVVMMLNLDVVPKQEGFVKYYPIGILIAALVVAATIFVIIPEKYGNLIPIHHSASFSNVSQLGMVLYTEYVYPFELAAVILLVAIIAAISLSLRKPRGKTQNISQQLRAEPQQRVRLVDLSPENKQSS